MRIEIVEREPEGVCDLTGKKDVEIWSVRPRGGSVTRVCTARLPEVLRVLSSVPPGSSGNNTAQSPSNTGKVAAPKMREGAA